MRLEIPEHEVRNFKRTITSDAYEREERDYKAALHAVLGPLLTPDTVGRSDFPTLLKGVLENVPDYEALSIDPQQQEELMTGPPSSVHLL